MRFHNPTKHEQKFSIGKHSYVVPPGANVDIPDNLAYVVKHRDMALVEGSAPDTAAPVAKPVEALPGRALVLLASSRVSPQTAERWKALYARAGSAERARLIEQLEALAEGRGSLDRPSRDEDGDAIDNDGAPGASTAEDDVEAQVGAAAAAVGKGRRKG